MRVALGMTVPSSKQSAPPQASEESLIPLRVVFFTSARALNPLMMPTSFALHHSSCERANSTVLHRALGARAWA
jgi:hypothetical protein